MDNDARWIAENTQGRAINLCHIISRPHPALLEVFGLEHGAIAIVSLTPGEAAILVSDVLTKASGCQLLFVDRYLGTLVLSGPLSLLQSTLKQELTQIQGVLQSDKAFVTQS